MAKSDSTSVLPKKAAVIATVDLPGVPAGTEGKVIIINGLSWIRYWVRFANGVVMGSINRAHLATPDEWARKLAGGDDVAAAGSGGGASDGDAAGGDADDGDGDQTVNGVVVPGRLLARSKAARARLATAA